MAESIFPKWRQTQTNSFLVIRKPQDFDWRRVPEVPIQFTAFYPNAVEPMEWRTLLAYVHLADVLECVEAYGLT
jgi:hypothetical protein